MTDKEVFETFMSWMGMQSDDARSKAIGEDLVVTYKDVIAWDPRFTSQGYDNFTAGAIFDNVGKMVRGYIDSHVAHESDNNVYIGKLLNE